MSALPAPLQPATAAAPSREIVRAAILPPLMTREAIERVAELLAVITNALAGKPFSWGDGQRQHWVPLLRAHGVDLVTETQVKKRGHRLKRGVMPVGSAYFGAPIQRDAALFVLWVQTAPLPRKAAA